MLLYETLILTYSDFTIDTIVNFGLRKPSDLKKILQLLNYFWLFLMRLLDMLPITFCLSSGDIYLSVGIFLSRFLVIVSE